MTQIFFCIYIYICIFEYVFIYLFVKFLPFLCFALFFCLFFSLPITAWGRLNKTQMMANYQELRSVFV